MERLLHTICGCCGSGKSREMAMSEGPRFVGLGPPLVDDVINCVEALPNNQFICGAGDGVITEFEYGNGTVSRQWQGHRLSVTKIRVQGDDDKRRIFSASRDLTVKMWNGKEAAVCQQTFQGHHTLVVSALTCHPFDENIICSGSRDNSVALWDVTTGVLLNSTNIARNLVTDLCWKGRFLAQTSEDKTLRLWDPRILQVAQTFVPKQQILTSCDVNGDQIATTSGGFNNTGCEITLWDSRKVTMPVHEFKGHSAKVSACRYIEGPGCTKTRYLASVSADRTLRIWDTDNLKEQSRCNMEHQLTALTQLPSDESWATRMAVGCFVAGVVVVRTDTNSFRRWQLYH